MTLGDGIRRNVAQISAEERARLRDAFIALDTVKVYPDGVTFWDKQEDIHKAAHAGGQDVHAGPGFLPWHRESVSYTHLRAHETRHDLVCRLLLEKKKKKKQ